VFQILLTTIFLTYTILSWRNFKLGLLLLTGLLPVYLLRFDIGPIPSTALEILILISIVVWILKLRDLKFRKGVWQYAPTIRPWIKPTILLIAAASIAVTVAPDPFSALGIWKAYFIEPILVAVMMFSCFDKKDFESALKALEISSIVLSVIGILQYLTGLGIPTPWDIELRITSIFDYPNALGLFLAPIVAMAIVRLSSCRRGVLQYTPTDVAIWIATALFGTIAIILSETEAALVAIPVALIITFLLSPKRVWHAKLMPKWRVGFEVLAVLIILVALIPTVREKIFLQDYSGQVRISQWVETAHLLQDHFVFGAGLNGYPTVLAEYHDPTLYEIFQYPHNIFLNIWVELGLLGLIAFFWFAFLILKTVLKSYSANKLQSETLALLAVFLVILIHGLVDVPYFKNDLAVMSWIFLASFITINKTGHHRPVTPSA